MENNDLTQDQEAAATDKQSEMHTPILRVEHLKKYFPIKTDFFGRPTRYLKAVDDITFDLERGKTIGVVGESGCGKTTLGRTILKLYESDGGNILFEGADITHLKKSQMNKYRTDIQLIFQDPYSSLPPRMTVGAIISEPVRVHKIVPKEEVHSYVLDIMSKCGLKHQHFDRYPHEFSGGQRQRICIARALAVKPKLVICDEPVSALDVSIQAQIINLLKELQNSIGLTYVFISHDLSVVKYITDNILVMYLGNAMEMSETEELFENPLHPYTQALFSAVPAPNPSVKMNRIVLEGDIPSPANPPEGCKFHTRCSKCMSACKYKVPKYTEVKPGHFVACHLYDDEVMSHLDECDAEYARITEERRIAAEQEEQKKFRRRHPFKARKMDAQALSPVPSDTEENSEQVNDAEERIFEPEAKTNTVPQDPIEQKPAETVAEPDKPVEADTAVEKAPEPEKAEVEEKPAAPTEPEKAEDSTEPEKPKKPTAKKSTGAKKSASAGKSAASKPASKTKSTTAKSKSTATEPDKASDAPDETAAAVTPIVSEETVKPAAKKSAGAKKSASASKSEAAKPASAKSTTAKSAASKSGSTKKSTTAKSTTTKSTTAKSATTKSTTAKSTASKTGGMKKSSTAKSASTKSKSTTAKKSAPKKVDEKPAVETETSEDK